MLRTNPLQEGRKCVQQNRLIQISREIPPDCDALVPRFRMLISLSQLDQMRHKFPFKFLSYTNMNY